MTHRHRQIDRQTDRQTHTETNCNESITLPRFHGGGKRKKEAHRQTGREKREKFSFYFKKSLSSFTVCFFTRVQVH